MKVIVCGRVKMWDVSGKSLGFGVIDSMYTTVYTLCSHYSIHTAHAKCQNIHLRAGQNCLHQAGPQRANSSTATTRLHDWLIRQHVRPDYLSELNGYLARWLR